MEGDATYPNCKGARYKNDGDLQQAGIIRVGWSYYNLGRSKRCLTHYRSFVYFDIITLPKDGLLVGAQLKYNSNPGGCPHSPKAAMLEQKWNQNSSLFNLNPSQYTNLGNLKKMVQKWLTFPSSNYGFIIAFNRIFNPHRDRNVCLIHYDNVQLIVKIRERIK